MLLKLAWRNVRRSYRDYAVYFVTLIFAVAVFYAFNSISDQKVLFDIQSWQSDAAELALSELAAVLPILSVVIACILALLIIYANRFLVRRRKQEFGTYLLLGMRPGQVSAILLMETAIVGVLSLAVGLALGVLASQGLSFASAALLEVPNFDYHFLFSPRAAGMTVGCFVLIFLVVALCNVVQVRKTRLIKLLGARAATERFAVRNPWLAAAGFVVAIVVLVQAYLALGRNGMVDLKDPDFMLATVLMLVGTLLLFWSVSGFVILVLQRLRGVYFRGTTMFTLRQIASRVNTAFLSLSGVAVLLFFAITIFSCGLGLANIYSGKLAAATQFDATFTSSMGTAFSEDDIPKGLKAAHKGFGNDSAAYIASVSPTWREHVASSVRVDSWETDVTYGKLAQAAGFELAGSIVERADMTDTLINAVGVSQYNELRRAVGERELALGSGQCALSVDLDRLGGFAQEVAASGGTLKLAGQELQLQPGVPSQQLSVGGNIFGVTLIVPDAAAAALEATWVYPAQSFLNIDYTGDTGSDPVAANAVTSDIWNEVADAAAAADPADEYWTDLWPAGGMVIAADYIADAVSLRVLMVYLGVYIGLVLLVATAAILAIQQLSEASDSAQRYRTLAQLGCDGRQLFGSLRTQVCIYFLAPLVVAAAHSTCAIAVMNGTLFAMLGVGSLTEILLAATLVLVVYGVYLLVTYQGAKTVVRSALGPQLAR